MTHEDRAGDYLEHVLIACNRALLSVRDVDRATFLQDFRIHELAIRAITVAGEAARRIRSKSPEFMDQHELYAFVQLIGMRNQLIHGYDETDLNVAWQTVTEDIPRLPQKVLDVLAAIGRTPDPESLHFQ